MQAAASVSPHSIGRPTSPRSPVSPASLSWQDTKPERNWKGKGKQVAAEENDETGFQLSEMESEYDFVEEDVVVEGSYPPMHDEELEERKIIENLKRWEAAERLRRKNARESRSLSGAQTNPRESAVRRASLLWKDSNRDSNIRGSDSRRRSSIGSQVPLRDDDRGSLDERHRTSRNDETNPFNTPRSGSPNPPENEESGSLMAPTSPLTTPTATTPVGPIPFSHSRPILDASESSLSPAVQSETRLPAPKPLDLPRAVSPPAPTRDMNSRGRGELEDDELPTRGSRWWTDWLCGCREEGQVGDGAAGRTNPFE